MIDTHAHIYLKEYRDDLDEVIERSRSVGVEKIYMPNIDSGTIDDMMKVAQMYPGYCVPMMGLHPGSVDQDFEKELFIVEEWIGKYDFAAVGEIGIDLYWDRTFEEQQKKAFEYQVELARKYNLPVVIHHRNAFVEAFNLVEKLIDNTQTGIFHCFTGSREEADKITGLGFYLGIGGVSTFKKGGLDQTLPGIDLDRIVLETDSPYLAPAPFRGKRNEPAYLDRIASRVAEIMNAERERFIESTNKNAQNIFKIF